MIVRNEQENVSPRLHSTSPPNFCMVLGGGPTSLQIFPGMEHERGLFNGLEGPSNGITEISADNSGFNEKKVETVATTSESPVKTTLVASTSLDASPPVPPVIIPAQPMAPPSQTLSPLHINTSDCSKNESPSETSAESRSSELPSNGSAGRIQKFQQPRNIRDYPKNRASTSTSVPIVMGPPTNSNAPVLLSPAGNLNNAYQRMSSGDSAPASPSFMSRQLAKSGQIPHPLAVQRSALQSPHPRSSQPSFVQSPRASSSTTSPQNGRKEHEMTRRRALVDRIGKSRGADYVHLLPQVEALTHTQTSILLRKHRGSLVTNEVPYSLQQMIDCTIESDRTAENFVKKIRDVNHKRNRYNDFDELTDVSDIEDEAERSGSQERSRSVDGPKWTVKRMRYCGMLSRVEALLAEKTSLMGMLENQKTVMDVTCGVRFENEDAVPRRRRRLNGMYYLYDKSPFVRASAEEFGCARAMPIQSWTKRRPIKDVFEDSPEKNNSNNFILKPPGLNEKWVATGQHNTVVHLTKGEIRELTEHDYEEYRSGEGLQQVNELSATDPLQFLPATDFTPFEERQMAYMYRLSTAPSSTIRKKHGKAIFFETDDRKAVAEKSATIKIKTHNKKERKRVEDPSSDEESKIGSKKKPRGRPSIPAHIKKKPSRVSVSVVPSNKPQSIYIDYLFEDFMNEDICVKHLPSRVTYAQFQTIHVPEWSQIADNYWEEFPDTPVDDKPPEDLLITVAKQHHRLMHMERERVQKDTEKRNRNRQSNIKSAATTPSQNDNDDGSEDGRYPPFDMRQFQPNIVPSRRRYASIAKPFEPRDFLKKTESTSTTE